MKRNAGFTLIEVMVVVVILGILAAVVVPKIMDKPDEARIVKAKQDVQALKNALDLYRLDNFKYPSTDQGLQVLVESSGKKKYLDNLPKDPWGAEYQYLNPGTHTEVDIYSLGADGRPGGEGVDADIGNWDS